MIPMPNFARSSSTEPVSAMVSMIVAHVVQPQPVLRHGVPQAPLVGRVPGGHRPLEVGEIFLRDVDGLVLVLDQDVDDAVRDLDGHRPHLLGRVDAESAALDHRRPAHAERRALGRDDHVAARDQRGVAGERAAVHDRDQRHQPAQLREGRERVRVDRDAGADVVLPRPAAAALAEQDDRQLEALRQLEHPVLLVVIAVPLRARQHGVVVVDDDGAGARLVEQRAVDGAHAGDHAVARRVLAQRLDGVSLVLPRDDERPVFLEGARDRRGGRCSRAACGSPASGAGRPHPAGSRPAPRAWRSYVLAQVVADVIRVRVPPPRRRRRPRPRPPG